MKIRLYSNCKFLSATALTVLILAGTGFAETGGDAPQIPDARILEANEEAVFPRGPVGSRTAEGRRPGRPEDRPQGGPPDRAEEIAMLDRLLAMPPEQLARVRGALDRVEAMSPEERNAMRGRLKNLRELSPEQREKMRENWRAMSPDERLEHLLEPRERRHEKRETARPRKPPHAQRPDEPARRRDGDRANAYERPRMEPPEKAGEMAILDSLLAMPPDHFTRLRRNLERVETMSPHERNAMRSRIEEFRAFSPEERQRMRENWRTMSPEMQRQHIREMRERRREIISEQESGDSED